VLDEHEGMWKAKKQELMRNETWTCFEAERIKEG
jgi:hypothetical protein